ncbi:sensor histidine kinase [Nonomuraea sp. 10N515B]|uniref:sensor histidine kinase n=1 Tax=Nonomuraea sp. 10N515B TaxID=3457422 RepID=UPI003FCC34D0
MNTRWALLPVAFVAGVASEWAVLGWSDPARWVPDLLAGLVLVGSGLVMWPSGRGAAVLLITAGFAWFAGNLGQPFWYWHRAPLVHLLLAFPGWRPTSRAQWAMIGAGYLVAVAHLWSSPLVGVALVTVLLLLRVRTAAGRRERVATRATAAFALILYAAAGTRLIFPAGDAAAWVTLAYQAVVAGIAVALTVTMRRRDDEAVTDLVVELTQRGSGTLRDALADVLGDPGLRVGYWRDGGYVDQVEARIALPTGAGGEAATFVSHDGSPFAVLVHDRSVLTDPALVAAVAAATRLTAANAALHAEIRAQLAELSASRRRLLVAADDERRRLEERLYEGPVRRLSALLVALPDRPHLRQAIEELGDLARGLHPRELARGLGPALTALAQRSAVPVRLSLAEGRLPAELEAAVYYVCAEALANVAKHARASAAAIEMAPRGRTWRVEITDDGAGGADPAAGSGLRGLADRIETFGGRLAIISPTGGGTRLTAELPLDGLSDLLPGLGRPECPAEGVL